MTTDEMYQFTSLADEPVTAVWCPQCKLPSGVIDFYAVTTIVPSDYLAVTKVAYCDDCGSEIHV